VAVLRTAPAAARVLDGLPGIRYSEQPVLRRQLVDPALAPAPVIGGAYEWQYSAAREYLVPASVLHAASAITIAVIDTGADVSAPDLAAKAPTTWSVRNNSSDVTDYYGHGTFVSSLAAGSTTNGEGVAGFGGDAKLLAVQASAPDGTFTDVDESAAIVYAVDHGAKIINMSFGGPMSSPAEQSAIAYAAAHGVLLVAAAGNSGQSGNQPSYPAALLQPLGSNGVGGIGLAVAASNLSGARASFSNYGSYISLAAPGENVFGALSSSADPNYWPRQSLPGSVTGIYGYGSGTSYSSPEVAGAAALVWAANPGLRATDVAGILKQSASGHGGWNENTGYGILDAAAAVASAQGTSVAVPTVSLGGTRSGLRVSLTWSSPGAISYRLLVTRDGGSPQILLGSATATATSYKLDAGHSYSFTVTATDTWGLTVASTPYTITLPYSAVKLDLRTSPAKSRQIRLSSLFAPESKGVARAGRRLVLESFDGHAWHRFAAASTGKTGVATWTLRLRRGSYRIRSSYAGADDLAPATSRAVTLRVR
jgi:subtilisin family serine protease